MANFEHAHGVFPPPYIPEVIEIRGLAPDGVWHGGMPRIATWGGSTWSPALRDSAGGVFPANVPAFPFAGPDGPIGTGWSWMALVSPLMEFNPGFDLGKSVGDSGNVAIGKRMGQPQITCPSNPFAGLGWPVDESGQPTPGGGWGAPAHGSKSLGQCYVLSRGTGDRANPRGECAGTQPQHPCQWGSRKVNGRYETYKIGFFMTPAQDLYSHDFNTNLTRAAHVRDGMSNVLFLGEWNPENFLHKGPWYAGSHLRPCTANAQLKPNSILMMRPGCTGGSSMQLANQFGFSSHHPGGVGMALGDGSIKFIDDGIDYVTWCYLANISDGNAVADHY